LPNGIVICFASHLGP